MKSNLLILISGMLLYCYAPAHAQCTPPANPGTTYGTNNVWIGYMYRNTDFTSYAGYVNQGTAANPDFDEDFDGDNVNYPTSSCNVNTETFSARFRLRKNFADADYEFTISADDGVRFSLDGGATWVIDEWHDQGYSTYTYTARLNGNYNMVLEYYENTGGNRLTFDVGPGCIGTGSQTTNGTGNIWRGYIYDGINFNTYKGRVNKGTVASAYFDENFGGDNVSYATNACAVQTETFSARYRLRKNFAAGMYIFSVGGDDGYRLSIDGGATWVIDNWDDHGYEMNSYVATLNGNVTLVLEYYENGGGNRISFDVGTTALPVNLLDLTGKHHGEKNILTWLTTPESTEDHFIVERSANGQTFGYAGRVNTMPAAGGNRLYSFTDHAPLAGTAWYRLKMVDLNGEENFSKIISINGVVPATIKIYPTIIDASRLLFVQTDRNLDNAMVTVTNTAGQKIYEKKISGVGRGETTSLSLPTTTLMTGTYLVQVKTGNVLLQKQLIIVQ